MCAKLSSLICILGLSSKCGIGEGCGVNGLTAYKALRSNYLGGNVCVLGNYVRRIVSTGHGSCACGVVLAPGINGSAVSVTKLSDNAGEDNKLVLVSADVVNVSNSLKTVILTGSGSTGLLAICEGDVKGNILSAIVAVVRKNCGLCLGIYALKSPELEAMAVRLANGEGLCLLAGLTAYARLVVNSSLGTGSNALKVFSILNFLVVKTTYKHLKSLALGCATLTSVINATGSGVSSIYSCSLLECVSLGDAVTACAALGVIATVVYDCIIAVRKHRALINLAIGCIASVTLCGESTVSGTGRIVVRSIVSERVAKSIDLLCIAIATGAVIHHLTVGGTGRIDLYVRGVLMGMGFRHEGDNHAHGQQCHYENGTERD